MPTNTYSQEPAPGHELRGRCRSKTAPEEQNLPGLGRSLGESRSQRRQRNRTAAGGKAGQGQGHGQGEGQEQGQGLTAREAAAGRSQRLASPRAAAAAITHRRLGGRGEWEQERERE